MAELGSLLGHRYRLDQVIGQGGMATIFRASDTKLGREVAVKVLRPEFGGDAQFVERFEREAHAAASLNHPNIVAVHDYGTDPAGPYIVMEQVAGGDLSVALGEHGALPPTAVARTGQQVADALAAAHARGLVHRDIKPGNILLSPDGRVQVADFGIAFAAADSPVTATGITLGSVLYFSPEQARGDTATAASDIYSLGLVMYELLTGQRAFSGDSPAAVAVARLSGGVPSPMAVRPDTPPALDAIVRWCLAVDPAVRPSASELSMALGRFIADPSGAAAYAAAAGALSAAGSPASERGAGSSAQATLTPLGQPRSDETSRGGSGPWTWLAAGFGLLVIVASGILLFLLFSGIGDEPAPPTPTPAPVADLVPMPDLVGLMEADAVGLAERWELVLETDYSESDEEAGLVIDQLPVPGVEIPVGTSVQVTVATQAETVVVPDVQGIKESRAVEQLEASGLRPGARFTADDALPGGYVISTDPRAGVSMTRGSLVDYVVSTGSVPGSTSRPAGTARPDRSAGPTPRPRVTPTAAASPGPSLAASRPPVVASSAPLTAAPTMLPSTPPPTPRVTGAPTATATTNVGAAASPAPSPAPTPRQSASTGPSPTPFPSHAVTLVGDFLCLDLATARSHIEEAGLLVGAMIPSDPAPQDDWIVHDQLPEAGDSVPIGSNVDLVLMDPQEPCPSG